MLHRNRSNHLYFDMKSTDAYQIFNLTKFDSYPRFLTSDIYKKALDKKSSKKQPAVEASKVVPKPADDQNKPSAKTADASQKSSSAMTTRTSIDNVPVSSVLI